MSLRFHPSAVCLLAPNAWHDAAGENDEEAKNEEPVTGAAASFCLQLKSSLPWGPGALTWGLKAMRAAEVAGPLLYDGWVGGWVDRWVGRWVGGQWWAGISTVTATTCLSV